MLTRFSFFIAVLAFGLVACEGPAGPMGPQGPQGETGPRGEIGPPREGIIIEQRLSRSLYDEDGNIFIEDDRITPTTFQALYLKAAFPNLGPDAVAYVPLDYLIVSAVSIIPEENELETPVLVVAEGFLLIIDSNRDLLAAAIASFFNGVDVDLAILVSQ